jgi:hypothetical protein
METKKILSALLMTAAITASFTSCSKDDDEPATDPTKIVTFEKQTLNAQKFWCGEKNNNGYEVWGAMVYPCTYTENFATFNTTYGVSYWMGYAISARTQTSFTQGPNLTPDDTPDQFNNITGKAHSGNNFCVVQTYGETIDFAAAAGVKLKGFWYTNSSYTVEIIKNGNAFAKKFGTSDWLTCTVTALTADGKTNTVALKLAENGDYVKEWKWADLSSLGNNVKQLSFVFTGSDSGEYGLNTPAYLCIDDMVCE